MASSDDSLMLDTDRSSDNNHNHNRNNDNNTNNNSILMIKSQSAKPQIVSFDDINNNEKPVFYNKHLSNMRKVIQNPPQTLQEAEQLFVAITGKETDDLSYILNRDYRRQLMDQSRRHSSHPGHELMVDLPVIGHICSFSGVDITCINTLFLFIKSIVFCLYIYNHQ